jgi:hypothetical protein
MHLHHSNVLTVIQRRGKQTGINLWRRKSSLCTWNNERKIVLKPIENLLGMFILTEGIRTETKMEVMHFINWWK